MPVTLPALRLGAMVALAVVLAACGGNVPSAQAANPEPAGGPVPPALGQLDPHIVVDQFGYRPGDPKVAVIRNPVHGFDAGKPFVPGSTYQLRRVPDGAVLFEGPLAAWNGGAVQDSSGDQGWWFDFSTVKTPGRYVIHDRDGRLRSPVFVIDEHVYRKVLKAAMRVFFYQRAGIAKRPPQAEACWADEPAYLGSRQDGEARDVTDRGNRAKSRDLRGGWFDAGDTNKYVTFASPAVHQLLTAWSQNPAVFTDDFDIPESGNGIPDLLDEVRWETDWLKRMQYADGSVALKVGEVTYETASPPSSNRSPRFYVPACTSATIATSGMLAHAAWTFGRFPALAREAQDLRARAERAWTNFKAATALQTECDTGEVHAGDADLNVEDQVSESVVAAVYLYAVTGEPAYQEHIRANYRRLRPYRDMGWSRYNPQQGDALLFYAALPGADRALAGTILADKRGDVRAGNQVYGFDPASDLYRAFLHDPQYHWGSNQPRANYGNTNLDAVHYDLALGDVAPYRTRALEVLHYFHGVNPFGMVYLSNMYGHGATRAANEIYHTWFQPKSRWSSAAASPCGPAPGYVPAGPNAQAVANGVPASLVPPAGQPAQKSYRDWNANWPENSWVVTEPAIYYQASYVKLLSAFAQ